MKKALHRLWSSHFVANPLIRREAGLWEGRSWWRSPLLIVLLLAVAVPSVEIVTTIVNWSSLAEVKMISDPMRAYEIYNQAAAARSVPMGHISKWSNFVLVPVLLISPFLLSARCWSREREQAQRHQLGASLITVPQLIGAKGLIWMSPILVMMILVLLQEVLTDVATVLWAPRDSFLWMGRVGYAVRPSGGVSTSEGIAVLAEQRWFMLLLISASAFTYLFGLGLAARLCMAGFQSTLAGLLTAAIAYAALIISLGGLEWIFDNALRWRSEEAALYPLVLLIQMLAARLCWRGLPARVAAHFGMER